MEENIPEQRIGGHSDTVSEANFNTENEAVAHFEIVKKRFLDINSWELWAGEEKADFTLMDANGTEIHETPQIGNLIRIKVPGLHNPTGDGYDWVRIEEVKTEENQHAESIYIRVRPTSDPAKPDEGTAHFFDEKATSNFIIRREGNKIFAEVHGRNEEPNTEDLSVLEKVRNFLVAVGGIIAGSKFQWKSLTDGLLSEDNC